MPVPKVSIIDIKENALFIADAHYPHHGDEFLQLLKKLESDKVKTPQLFLMGDIFDLLFGYSDYIKTFSSQAIELLNRLSETIEIHYLEGNHDFCLKELFPYIKVYSREEQPIEFKLNNQTIYLAHGDLYETGFAYNLYCKLLRNRITLTLLKPFEKQVIDQRMKKLKAKIICKPFDSFEQRTIAITKNYPNNSLIIEGHFHQAKQFNNYISLPSLACQKQIGIVINGAISFNFIK